MPSEMVWSDFNDPGISLFRGRKGSDSPTAFIRLLDDGDLPVRTDPLLYVRDDDTGTAPGVRLVRSTTTSPVLSVGTAVGTTKGALYPGGGLILGRDARFGTEFLTIDTQSSSGLVAWIKGAVAGNADGRYSLTITDSCSIYTHGAISSDGGSAIPGQIALLGKTFMFGANSDIAAGTDAACYVSFARAAALDHFQMISGPSTLRLRIKHDGDLVWSRGSGGTATFTMTPTSTGMQIGATTSERLSFFGGTPVVQPVAVADASDAASVILRFNELAARVRSLSLIAT